MKKAAKHPTVIVIYSYKDPIPNVILEFARTEGEKEEETGRNCLTRDHHHERVIQSSACIRSEREPRIRLKALKTRKVFLSLKYQLHATSDRAHIL